MWKRRGVLLQLSPEVEIVDCLFVGWLMVERVLSFHTLLRPSREPYLQGIVGHTQQHLRVGISRHQHVRPRVRRNVG